VTPPHSGLRGWLDVHLHLTKYLNTVDECIHRLEERIEALENRAPPDVEFQKEVAETLTVVMKTVDALGKVSGKAPVSSSASLCSPISVR
jgi:hypothetical protein